MFFSRKPSRYITLIGGIYGILHLMEEQWYKAIIKRTKLSTILWSGIIVFILGFMMLPAGASSLAATN